MQQTDVLVLGGGVAGVAAALAARATGAATTLVRRGPGATALVGGGWRGVPPEPFTRALRDAGLRLEACTAPLPHPDGRLLSADLAPTAQAHAAIAAGAELALVCGIAGLPSFRARALATLWAAAAGLRVHSLVPVTLTLADTPAGGWSPVSLAAALEREPQRLAAPLAHAVRDHGAARVFLPAVLGLDEHGRTYAEVCDTVRVVVGECLGTAPSLPGWRLDRALLLALSQAGVNVVHGDAVSTETPAVTANGRSAPAALTITTAEGPTTISARALVLATGKYIGGGIAADPLLTESALGSDAVLDRPAMPRDATEFHTLTGPWRDGRHAILAAGVAADGAGRLIARAGSEPQDNVLVAGSVRAGSETAALGLGEAAQEGWAAGLRAAAAAASRS